MVDWSAVEQLDLEGATLTLYRRPWPALDTAALLNRLVSETAWRQETISLFGKTHLQPRLQAWYGDPGASYRYSGKTYDPQPWTALLQDLRERAQALTGASFNSVLLNFYRDGSDSMGLHADDEPELGPRPLIASLSLGEERALVFRPRDKASSARLDVPLPDGSVLVMAGETQKHWKHGIRKLRRACGPRVNLTFREVSCTAGA